MESKEYSNFRTALKGAAMGIAEVIPGVSGGTIAFITGIYEILIETIKAFGPGLWPAVKERGAPGLWDHINGPFLIWLISGMIIGLGVGVFGVSYFLEHYPEILWAFFFGLIIASALYIFRMIDRWSYREIIALVAGTVVAYVITVSVPATGSEAPLYVMLSGFVAISALILPGVSGSFILVLMGMYTIIIPGVKEFIGTFSFDVMSILLFFAVGAVLGLFTFSRILSWLFKHYHNPLLAVLTGFMLGSLNKIWPWRIPVQWLSESGERVGTLPAGADPEHWKVIHEINVMPGSYPSDPHTLWVILALLAGIAIVGVLDRYSGKF